MKTSKLIKLLHCVITLSLLALPLGGCSLAHVATPSPAETQAIAEEAYIFAYPMLENYKTMYIQTINLKSPYYMMPFNQLMNANRLAGPADKSVVRPNNDTLYSFAWLDLRTEPLVISVPEIKGRYYSFQLVDMYTFDFDYIGTRATGTAAGSYLIAGPAWHGAKPKGVNAVFRSEGNFVFSLTRTAVYGQKDVASVLAIQQQYKIQPLSAFLGKPAPSAAPSLTFPPFSPAAEQSADFIKYFNFLLGQVAIESSEKALIAKFGRIGIGPNRTFDSAALSADTLAAINKGVASAMDKIKAQVPQMGERKNGWILAKQIFGTREQMNGQYLTRATAAYMGLYGNVLEEAYYPSSSWDVDGDPLDGSKHSYLLKFTKDEIPAVNAFWSVTMYGSDQFLVENPIQRYSIGDRTEGLKYGADGSLEIYIQNQSPGADKESNWLPSPDGPFTVTLRMYLPKPSALNPLYAPPGIQPQD